jgi:hypothetical protein
VRAQDELARGRGLAEWRVRLLDWIEPWETYQPTIEEIIDLGDRVVVLGTDRGRIKGVDREIDGPKGLVLYWFKTGKVTRVEHYFAAPRASKPPGFRRGVAAEA